MAASARWLPQEAMGRVLDPCRRGDLVARRGVVAPLCCCRMGGPPVRFRASVLPSGWPPVRFGGRALPSGAVPHSWRALRNTLCPMSARLSVPDESQCEEMCVRRSLRRQYIRGITQPAPYRSLQRYTPTGPAVWETHWSGIGLLRCAGSAPIHDGKTEGGSGKLGGLQECRHKHHHSAGAWSISP